MNAPCQLTTAFDAKKVRTLEICRFKSDCHRSSVRVVREQAVLDVSSALGSRRVRQGVVESTREYIASRFSNEAAVNINLPLFSLQF